MRFPVTVLLAPVAALAKDVHLPDITIGAEYGTLVIEGTKFTAPFRKAGANRPMPCNNSAIPSLMAEEQSSILVRGTPPAVIGGVLRAIGCQITTTPLHHAFWSLVEFVERYGQHKIKQWIEDGRTREYSPEIASSGTREVAAELFYAMLAWYRTQPRKQHDKTNDITGFVLAFAAILHRLLNDDDAVLRRAGLEYLKNEQVIDKATIVASKDGVILRFARDRDLSCNHLYGANGRAVVTFNAESKRIIVSTAEAIHGFDLRGVVRTVVECPWPIGHSTHVKTPITREMTFGQAEILYDWLIKHLPTKA